ncbi:MAG: PAS domain-containing protein [Phaeodactylibacter xiamenensis]|uniref:PAS domain-containing protein n=1 Tax=Phaeodactylibacter xiamenensis TaxID=1524460 RepID=A0A098S971_9BACT|nr:PAS domain-containing protein [Phaeodactylibacter xiamenensis]KGE88655.1 hypothetical protein IX84_08290 [Phaeodactylibacter xiamenensis]MCR9053456.1 PAS domain-containing protein [bacterium]
MGQNKLGFQLQCRAVVPLSDVQRAVRGAIGGVYGWFLGLEYGHQLRIPQPQGQIEWVSDNVERQLGYTPAAVQENRFFLGYLHPDDQDRVLAEVTSFASNKEEEAT